LQKSISDVKDILNKYQLALHKLKENWEVDKETTNELLDDAVDGWIQKEDLTEHFKKVKDTFLREQVKREDI